MFKIIHQNRLVKHRKCCISDIVVGKMQSRKRSESIASSEELGDDYDYVEGKIRRRHLRDGETESVSSELREWRRLRTTMVDLI